MSFYKKHSFYPNKTLPDEKLPDENHNQQYDANLTKPNSLSKDDNYYKFVTMQQFESLDYDSSIDHSELIFIAETNYNYEIRF